MPHRSVLLLLSPAWLLLQGCMAGDMAEETRACEAGAGCDGGIDGDIDADGDGDGDAPTAERYYGDGIDGSGLEDLCENGLDDDLDGLDDCQDLGCLGAPRCCAPTTSDVLEGDFSRCTSGLEGCSWSIFAGAGDDEAVRLDDGVVLFGGDGVGEVGMFSAPIVGLAGEPTLTFVAQLHPSCGVGPCPQVFGVALSTQQTLSSGTGVTPTVGVVLDGEVGAVHFYVGDRRERTLEVEDPSALAEPRLYGLRLAPGGGVSFWALLPADEFGRELQSEPTYRSRTSSTGLDAKAVHAVAFGRLQGEEGARLSALDLERQICDVPDSFIRPSTHPVIIPDGGGGLARDPALLRPDQGAPLLAYYQTSEHIEVASSEDGGLTWSVEGSLYRGEQPSGQYGRVSLSAPTVVRWPNDEGRYHMWYVGEAESDGGTPAGVTPTALLHAVSDDGVDWSEAALPVALEAGLSHPWMAQLSDPTVIAVEGEGRQLRMWFRGHYSYDVGSEIISARSDDGVSWELDPEPISFRGSANRLPFERDGRSGPVVVSRGGAFHMWYVGHSGARSTIGYAVSADGLRWERFGPVLEASLPWESTTTSGPAVLFLDNDEATDSCLLWYHGGPRGRERIGLVTRQVPSWSGS